MAFQCGNDAGCGRTRLVILFLIFLTLYEFSVVPVSAQENLTAVLESEEIVHLIEGDFTDINVSIPGLYDDDPEIVIPSLSEGLTIEDGPFLIRSGLEYPRLEMRVKAESAGRYVVETPTVIIRGEKVEPLSILIEVAMEDNPDYIPYSARWRTLRDDMHVGQSFPVILELYNIDQFTYPENIVVNAPDTGFFEEVSGIGAVGTTYYGDLELFQIPVASFIFTPSEVGPVEIPPAGINALGRKMRTDPLVLTIEELPESSQEYSAVGDLALIEVIDDGPVLLGDEVSVIVEIEGKGNIPTLRMPEVDVTGLVQLDTNEVIEVVPDNESFLGYRGNRSVTFRFEVTDDGEVVSIERRPFTFYNPENGEVTSVASRNVTLELLSEAPEDREALILPLLPIDDLYNSGWLDFFRYRWIYVLFLIPLIARVLLELTRFRKSVITTLLVLTTVSAVFVPDLNRNRLERARALYEAGEAGTAGVLYDLEIQEHPYHAGLRYNRAALAIASNRPAIGIYHLRKALRFRSATPLLRSQVERVEEYYNLQEQYSIPVIPRADVWLLAAFLLWNAIWLIVSLKHGAIRSIILIVSVLLILVIVSGLIWSVSVAGEPEAALLQETVIRRIPDEQASPWVAVGEAGSVMVELRHDEFYLIRTRSGVQGWIPVSSVLYEGKNR